MKLEFDSLEEVREFTEKVFPPPHPLSANTSWLREFALATKGDRAIAGIKALRVMTGWSLKEAKDFWDSCR